MLSPVVDKNESGVHVLLKRELKEINELGEVERGNGAI
jgi:hypothetical protein